ncbi:MAG: cysteine synthase [Zetaproteobacteria bacterium]|nr:MAG: cysteine synthase [Zetaproteobacteria bacterium]
MAAVAGLVGNTPLIRLRRVVPDLPEGVRLLAKLERFNPGGSVKDRPALWMIRDGIDRGLLTPEKTILDSTSGNTGIALAMLGAALGYRVRLVMPGNVSDERKRICRAFGAELLFSDPLEGSDGAILEARRIYEMEPARYFKPDQYNNPANPRAHEESTGPEIWRQTEGEVTHFVAAIGTSGTLMGTGRYLKRQNPAIRVVAAEPDSPFHGIEGLKHMASSILPGIYDPEGFDEKIGVDTERAYRLTRELARREGILAGQSCGCALAAAIEVAGRCRPPATIVVIFPDGGEKYLSTPVFADGRVGIGEGI